MRPGRLLTAKFAEEGQGREVSKPNTFRWLDCGTETEPRLEFGTVTPGEAKCSASFQKDLVFALAAEFHAADAMEIDDAGTVDAAEGGRIEIGFKVIERATQ